MGPTSERRPGRKAPAYTRPRATVRTPRPAAEPGRRRARAVAGRDRAPRAGEEEADAASGLAGAGLYRNRPEIAAAEFQRLGLGAPRHRTHPRPLGQTDARVGPRPART